MCITPNPKTGGHLCSQDFALCLKFRRGVNIYQKGTFCKGCGEEFDRLWEHAMNCGYGRGRSGRHNMVRDIIADVARSANLAGRVEVPRMIEGTQERPGDVVIQGFRMGRDSVLDVTVVNPLQQNSMEEAAHTAGVAKGRKRRQYEGRLLGHQIFKPVAFKTLGGRWDEEAMITTILARNQGKEEAEVQRFTVQRISIAIQRWNAVCFVDRVRGEMAEEEDVLG